MIDAEYIVDVQRCLRDSVPVAFCEVDSSSTRPGAVVGGLIRMMYPSTGGSVRCLLDTISGGAPTLHPRLAVHPSSKVLGIDALDFFELGLGFGGPAANEVPGGDCIVVGPRLG